MPPSRAYDATRSFVSLVTVSTGKDLPQRNKETKFLSVPSETVFVALLLRCFKNCCNDAPDADAVHAAKINRTFAQKTRRTRRVGFEQMIPRISRQTRPAQFRRR